MHSYICIVAFHLGTIEEPREWCDIGDEPEDDEWWTRLEDGRMDPDVHDRRKMLAERLFSNQQWPSVNPRQAPDINPVFQIMHFICYLFVHLQFLGFELKP